MKLIKLTIYSIHFELKLRGKFLSALNIDRNNNNDLVISIEDCNKIFQIENL